MPMRKFLRNTYIKKENSIKSLYDEEIVFYGQLDNAYLAGFPKGIYQR